MHEATGTLFEGFTDDRGNFRIPVRIGVYRITAELQGFATLPDGVTGQFQGAASAFEGALSNLAVLLVIAVLVLIGALICVWLTRGLK